MTLLSAFIPNVGPENNGIRNFGIAVGFVGIVTGVASRILGTLPLQAANLVITFSVTTFIGGVVGSVGLIAFSALAVLGIALATPLSYPMGIVYF